VRIATSASFVDAVERSGFTAVEAGLDWLLSEPGAVRAEAGPEGLDRAGRISWIFRGVAPEPMAHDLLALSEHWRPDLVIFDNVERGGLLFAEAAGIPFAFLAHDTFLPSGLGVGEDPEQRMAFRRRRGLDRYEAARVALGLEPDLDERRASSQLVLLMMPKVLWTLPPAWVLGGELVPVRPEPIDLAPVHGVMPLPAWIDAHDAPLAVVTLGTVFAEAPDTLDVAVDGLMEAGYQVVVAGAATDLDDSAVAYRRWVPMAQLVASADLVVTHGGIGTVTAALVAATPLIVIPQALDHPLTALRITAAGLGMTINKRELSVATMRSAAQHLRDPSFSAAAERVAAAITALPSAAATIPRLEQHAALRAG
jgi:UDP:flavonoid glycosyltransferase YjiC (YdhE family)